MIVLAIIPGVSVLTVTARAAAFGFSHGFFASLGIVVGDIIFILIAVYGLAVIAGMMGEQFTWIQYIGGVYLIWLGVTLWRAEARAGKTERVRESTWSSSFLAGLLITLADQKAILFYLGFFPAFIDLAQMTPADTLTIVVIAAIGVGGAKLVYAWLAGRASILLQNTTAIRGINLLAASIMFAVGMALIFKARGVL
ncbi:MAG: LysE family translocator [Gammaproteobacteria bacterium]|nr:LysE family translocator [Gammaproteobacteria bacterium]